MQDTARLPAHFTGGFLRTKWGAENEVDAFAPQRLREMELSLMKALDWSINYVSPVEIAGYLLAAMPDRSGDDNDTQLRHNVGVLLDAAFFADSLVLGFTPVEIALGAVALARDAARLSLGPLRALFARLGAAWPAGRMRHCAKQLRVMHVFAQMGAPGQDEAVDTSWGYLEPAESTPTEPAAPAVLSIRGERDAAHGGAKPRRVSTPTSIARFMDWGDGESGSACGAGVARQQDREAQPRTCGKKRKRATETRNGCQLLPQHEVMRRLEPMRIMRAFIEPHSPLCDTGTGREPAVKEVLHVLKCDSEGKVGVHIAKPGWPFARGGIAIVEVPPDSDNKERVEPLDEIVEIDGTCVRQMELCEVLHLFQICAGRADRHSGIPVVLRRILS